MLSLSWINLPNISISGLINPRSENIVQILVATFTLLALLPRSFYFQSILRDRLNLRLADPQVYITFPSPFYLSFRCFFLKLVHARLVPRQPMWWITFARDTHYLRVRSSTATYWSYVKRAAIYLTFISQSFARGNNSKDPGVGRVSGVVVDEGGHTVCLLSVTWNVVVNGGWSLMRGVVNEGFYCIGFTVTSHAASRGRL